jgi:hypothetical protein
MMTRVLSPKLWRNRIIALPVINVQQRKPEFAPCRNGSGTTYSNLNHTFIRKSTVLAKFMKTSASLHTDWMVCVDTEDAQRDIIKPCAETR